MSSSAPRPPSPLNRWKLGNPLPRLLSPTSVTHACFLYRIFIEKFLTLDIKNDQGFNRTEKTWRKLERSWSKKKAGRINLASKVPGLGHKIEE
jgi:hypothetical protein